METDWRIFEGVEEKNKKKKQKIRKICTEFERFPHKLINFELFKEKTLDFEVINIFFE